MDWLTFTDHLIGHLIWPAAVIGLVVFLSKRHRAALDALLGRVRKAKVGPFEAELDELKAEAEAASLPPVPPLPPSEPEPPEPPEPTPSEAEARVRAARRMAARNPRNAILQSYLYLNGYLLGFARGLDPEQTRFTDGSPATMRAAVVALLAPEHVDVLDRLRETALSALEDEDVSPRQAREYVDLVMRLMAAIRQRRPRPPEEGG
jgi:hypothetical protein